jgi:hypothetical protein
VDGEGFGSGFFEHGCDGDVCVSCDLLYVEVDSGNE